MANHEHFHSAGTTLGYSSTGTGYVTLTDVRKIKAAPMTREKSKDTSLDSPSQTDLYTGGWKATGPATFSVYMTEIQFLVLQAIYNTPCTAASVYYWIITYPKLSTEATNGPTIAFQAVMTGITVNEASIDSNDKICVDFELQGSGVVTFTAGS